MPIAHAINKLLRVATVRARNRIGAEDDLQTVGRDGAAEQIKIERQRLLHRLESLFRVVADSEIVLLVVEIILDHQPRLRIEPGAALGHELQVIIGGIRPVLDLRATGKSCHADRFFVRVHHRPQALRFGFAASGFQLLLG